MLYWAAKWLAVHHSVFRVFGYLTLRSILAAMSGLSIALLVGPGMIERLSRRQIGQVVRDDGPKSHLPKAGTPTMGGALIIIAIVMATLLWADLANRYVWLALGVTLGFGLIGFVDDYLKLVVGNSRGLMARWKYFWQSLLGLLAAFLLFRIAHTPAETTFYLPFFKNATVQLGLAGFVLLGYLMIVGMSNAVNLTDGLDGLAIGPAVMVAGGLSIFAYASGNAVFASYLAIPPLPGAGELAIFCTAIVGAGLGFLWFNTYPAQVFMGDIGALALGAALGFVAMVVRQELVTLFMGGIFVLETASVILQVASFKLTGKRLFRMAPIHHHFELKGWAEPKVIVRFWIISLLLMLTGLATLKLRHALIVGLGISGLSAARYLHATGCKVTVIDSRAEPPQRAALLALDPAIALHTGPFDSALLAGIDALIVSPGVALQGAFFDAARARRLPLIGDIELFARASNAPVAGITGTNGKSTVTTLVGRMAERGGKRVRVGGNLGEPALQLLDAKAELYVLELSSYQLQTTDSLQLEAATVLNVTPDHLDRYASVEEYAAAKARIFRHCGTAVINADDARTRSMVPASQRSLRFSLASGGGAEFALIERADGAWLACRGQALLAASELKIAGRHNIANALAALAMGETLGLDLPSRLAALREFTGLPHRTQWVADVRGVRYIDDSKGTNVGATLAAVGGLPAPLLLIAGGEGKGQDFLPLRAALAGKVRLALLIGVDAPALGAALAGVCAIEYCPSLENAVRRAAASARAGEIVLLSPACASFDMFRDYAHRGAVFAAAVRELAA